VKVPRNHISTRIPEGVRLRKPTYVT